MESDHPEPACLVCDLPPGRLRLTRAGWDWAWDPPGEDVLCKLVHVFYPQMSRFALDVIVTCGQHGPYEDACQAYAEKPLPEPPEEHVRFCYSWDFRGMTIDKNLLAIVLAGTPSHHQRLWHILDVSCFGGRDAAIYAASTYRDREIVEKVVELACLQPEGTLGCGGEMGPFLYTFRRWLRDGVLTPDELLAVLRRYEQPAKRGIKPTRMMNYIAYRQWITLPFPEEYERDE